MPSLSFLHLDPAPLRSAAFTRLLVSRTITRFGSTITSTAVLLHVAQLTNSPLATGGTMAVQLVPILVLGLYGGHLADRFDRRKVAFVSEVLLLAVSLVLIATSLQRVPSIPIIYAVVAASSTLASAQRAALDAAVPRVVTRDQLSAASGWLSGASSVARLAAPALAAALFYAAGSTVCYAIDSATFALSAWCLMGLPSLEPPVRDHPLPVLRSLAEGLRYVQQRPDLRSSYLLDLVAMAFASPTTMLPFLALAIHQRAGSGVLFAAEAAGSLIMVAVSGWTSRVTRIGLPLTAACAVYGLSTTLLGATTSLLPALLILGIGGAADAISVIFRDTLWNATIPDHLRGRVAGVETVSYAIGAPLSGILLGGFGEWFGFRTSLIAGGITSILLITLITSTTPALRTITIDHP